MIGSRWRERARSPRVVAVVTIGLAVLCVLGAVLEPRRAAASYLAAYAAALTTVIALLLLVMIVDVSGGTILRRLHRPIDAILATMPALALLFVPVLVGAHVLYPWTAGAAVAPALRNIVAAKQPYLATPFAVSRAVVYWMAWIAVAEIARRDIVRAADDPATHRRPFIDAIGIPVMAVTLTLASFDWLMSLDPAWSTSVYPVYVFAGATTAALALLALCSAVTPIPRESDEEHQAIGNLLLTFILLWVYLGYSQWLIIWIADLPRDVGWYVVRARGAWGGVAVALVVGHCFLPFCALLLRIVKRSMLAMGVVGAWMLAMHYLDLYWLVLPSRSPQSAAPSWLDPLMLLFVICAVYLAALLRPPRVRASERDLPAGAMLHATGAEA